MRLRKILNLLRNSKNLFKSFWNEGPSRGNVIEVTNNIEWESGGMAKDKDKRIKKRPIDIYEEIISEKPKINLKDLDKQIKLVKERMNVLKQHTRGIDLSHEKMALSFLKARKRYIKYKGDFQWAITNKKMIDKLCKKYKVKLGNFSNYYRNIPKEGVEEIERFGRALRSVTNIDPLFKLIIDDGGKEERKDPILLAASPFGNWYYILGAWDKEVEIVDALIYKGK